jgi:hypothetical protein
MVYAVWQLPEGRRQALRHARRAGQSMMRKVGAERRRWILSVILAELVASTAHAQNRGVYPLGLSALNSGVSAEPGITYNNAFLFYSRSEQKGGNGEVLATGQQSVLLDMNTLLWASAGKIAVLGDAAFSSAVTIPIANNSLSSSANGAISGGGGVGDLYFQPVILAWRNERASIRGILGFLAPTGEFNAGASDNVGNGYWTPVIAAGETFYLSRDKATTLSLFEMYEFHSTQSGTHIHPGETLDLDYSLMRAVTLPDSRLQVGLVGYAAWQTTAKTGPEITPAQEAQRYRVNALGVGFSYALPARQVSLSFKYFDEFGNRWTYQGYSIQISVGIGF